MPYLRYRQDLRLAARAAYRAQRETMRAHALTAWQTMVSNWGSANRRPPGYEDYLRRNGLHPTQDRMRRKARPVTQADRNAIAAVEDMIRTYSGPLARSA